MSTNPDEKTPAAPSSVEDKFYPKHTGAKSAPPPEDKSSETPVQTGAVQTEAAPEPADTDPEPLVEKPTATIAPWRKPSMTKVANSKSAIRTLQSSGVSSSKCFKMP